MLDRSPTGGTLCIDHLLSFLLAAESILLGLAAMYIA